MRSPLIIHDFFTHLGGGERVALSLARHFKAELWGGEFQPAAYPDGVSPCPRSLHAYSKPAYLSAISKTWALMRAFENFPLCSAPWTVFSGSLSLLAAPRIAGPKILYCHTPPRMLFDQRAYFQKQIPCWFRPAWSILVHIYKHKYLAALQNIDTIIANSQTVRQRIETFLGRKAVVVHPPCDTDAFKWIKQKNFFLSTARVDPLKRVRMLVEAFSTMPDKKLVVISGGSDLELVKRKALHCPNIKVLGWVNETRLSELIGTCLATLYIPIAEDFGISPLESMACGKPVIGVAEGGLLETMGKNCENQGQLRILPTGIHLPASPTPTDIKQAVHWLTPKRALKMRHACETRAALFSEEAFLKGMQTVLEASGKA